MMLKLFPFGVETQTDRTLHINEYCRQHGGRGHGTNRAGKHRINDPKQAELLNYVFTDNYCVVYN
jgi:hypothetical protein